MLSRLATVRRHGRLLALVFLSLLTASSVAADPAGRVGRIAWLFGSVYLHQAESGESSAAVLNWPLTTGDVLSTGAGGRAELQIGSTLLQLGQATVLEFVQLDDQRLALRLLDGSVIARFLSREAAGEFELATREGRFEVREPGRYRFDADRSGVAATAYSGGIRLLAADTSLVISTGQSARIWNSGRTQYQIWAPVNDEFAAWSSGRDRQSGAVGQPRYVSPEMTGAADLDAHGDWQETPAYGAVWFPRAVAADWAPYRAGRWAWVEPWGWTWVGDEPWGFAPFHYGRWAYLGGAWGWVPGNRVARPVYAPALVAWVGAPGGRGLAPTAVRPAVGWFPLAPREIYIPAYRSSTRHLREVNSPQVTNITDLTEITIRPEAVAARTRYANQYLPQAVTAVPEEAMRQHRPVREAAIRPADRALLSSQPAQVRAPLEAPGRDDSRRRASQMQPPEERPQRPASGPLLDSPPAGRGDARQAPPPVMLPPPATPGTVARSPSGSALPPGNLGVGSTTVPAAAPSQLPAPGSRPVPISPPILTTPVPKPLPPAGALFPPTARDALPQPPVAQPLPEAAPGSARRPDVRLPPAVPRSPMVSGASPVLPGERRGQGGLSIAAPASERRERAADAGGRPFPPSVAEEKDRRPLPPAQGPASAPAMTMPRPVVAPAAVPLPRIDAPAPRPVAPQPMAMPPQRFERPPVEAARPATVVRPERTEARQAERIPAREEPRQQFRQEAHPQHSPAVVPERAVPAPARADSQGQRERPGGAERPPGAGRPDEKRSDPREEQRKRMQGVQ